MNGIDALTVPGVPGAEVREVAELPESLDGAVRVGGFSIARRDALLQTVPGVARFLITDGRLIQFVREVGADDLAIEQFLAGSARAALVHQLGGLPLHAACLLPPHGRFAVAITGPSGAGKSTMAAELVRRGWTLLGDDVTPIYADCGGVKAWPSRGLLKLWRDACDRLAIDANKLQPLPGERDKYLLSVEAHPDPAPLSYIFLLERGLEGGIIRVEGVARLASLRANTYKANYLHGLKCIESHFRISCRISEEAQIGVVRWSGHVAHGADLIAYSCTS